MNAALQISKLDAARRQLETAVTLYFNWGDPVSIHTLTSAARNILANLCDHRNIKPLLLLESLIDDLVKPDRRKEFRTKVREAENFFKHADRDPDTTLKFNSASSEFMLLEAVEIYFPLTSEHPPLFHLYRAWWMLQNHEALMDLPPHLKQSMSGIKYSPSQRSEFFRDMLPTLFSLRMGS